jgi:hypothetical protein
VETINLLFAGFDGGKPQLNALEERLLEAGYDGTFVHHAPYEGVGPYLSVQQFVNATGREFADPGTAKLRLIGLSMGGQIAFLLHRWLLRAGWNAGDITVIAIDPPYNASSVAGIQGWGTRFLGYLPGRRRSRLTAQCAAIATSMRGFVLDVYQDDIHIITCKGNKRVLNSDRAIKSWQRRARVSYGQIYPITADHDLLSPDVPLGATSEWQARHARTQDILRDTLAEILRLQARLAIRYRRLHWGRLLQFIDIIINNVI